MDGLAQKELMSAGISCAVLKQRPKFVTSSVCGKGEARVRAGRRVRRMDFIVSVSSVLCVLFGCLSVWVFLPEKIIVFWREKSRCLVLDYVGRKRRGEGLRMVLKNNIRRMGVSGVRRQRRETIVLCWFLCFTSTSNAVSRLNGLYREDVQMKGHNQCKSPIMISHAQLE